MKTDTTKTIPMKIFKKAALTYFKCQPGEIEIRMITENKEAFVIYKGEGYKISTREMFREDIESKLKDKEAALDIDLRCWIQATKNTVKINRILAHLIPTLRNVEQAQRLLIAIVLASCTDDTDVAFWEILARIDRDGELLGNSMVIVAQICNGPGLINDLTELQVMHGNQVYNKFEGGIFETVRVDDQREQFEFYLYSAEHHFGGQTF